MRSITTALLLVVFSVAGVVRGADDWQRRLPPEWLGVVAVNDLPEFDRQTARLSEMFGMDAPGLVRLIEAAGLTELTDAKGSWLIGLAQGPLGAEEPYPFAMIPVKDFGEFVKALDGDRREMTAVVTLAQQDLLAGNCGQWVLLMNPGQEEIFDSVMARDAITQEVGTQIAKLNGIATGHVSPMGLKWLNEYLQTNEEEPRALEIARRRRRAPFLSLDGLRESLRLDKPLWRWVAGTFSQMGVAVDFEEGGGVLLKVVAAKPKAVGGESRRLEETERDLGGEREWIFRGGISMSPEVAELAAGLQVALLKCAPDDLGVKQFSSAELGSFEDSLKTLLEGMTLAEFSVLASEELPIFGNRLALLKVSSDDHFMKSCDDLMQHWNSLMRTSKAEVKLVFAAEPVEIAGHAGRRYFVDMVEAVDVPRSKEVAKMMADMFGPEGILNWYVMPIEDDRVLVGNLPRDMMRGMMGDANRGEVAKPQAAGGRFWLDASAYVDWGKRRDLAMMGEVIGGPKFVPLPKSEPLEAGLSLRDKAVQLEIALPQDLLETLGRHAQELREP